MSSRITQQTWIKVTQKVHEGFNSGYLVSQWIDQPEKDYFDHLGDNERNEYRVEVHSAYTNDGVTCIVKLHVYRKGLTLMPITTGHFVAFTHEFEGTEADYLAWRATGYEDLKKKFLAF